MKVLILSVSAGQGHGRAAEAIKSYYSKHYEDVTVEIIDSLKYINPIIDKVVVGTYLKSLSAKPSIYAKIYENADNDDDSFYSISNISALLHDILSGKIRSLIEDYKPNVVLCTHPFPLEMISILKRKGKINVPAAAVLTDYAPHSFWFYDYIDAYIIPHEDFIQDLVDKGISKKIIHPLGIPVMEEFLTPIDKKEARRQLGLDENKTTVLLMGGGLGIGNLKTIFEKISFSSLDMQLIACTGKNYRLKNQLEDILSKCSKKSLIFEYTDKVSLLMSASDVLISKPGGLTITESLIKGLPVVITSAIPGQEEKNADYLLNNGIAARVRKSENIISILTQLLQSPKRLFYMRESALEKSKPHATRRICELLLQMAEKNL